MLAIYNYNKLKPQIARMVKDATGRELNLGGEINLDFGFSPALVVTDVTFANAPWGSQPEMIMAEILGIAIGYEMAGRKSGKATAPSFYAVSRNRWLI